MNLVRGFLDRIVLIGGVLCGGMTPSFMAQYRQRVGGQLSQVVQDLAPFQQIANLRHQGSLDALVAHHLKSTDPTFQAEGAAIKAMVDAALRLKEAFEGLNGTLTQQVGYLLQHADPEVLKATWSIYQPSFLLSIDGLIFAVSFGLIVWLVFLGTWMIVAGLATRGRGAGSARSHRGL
ncbi:MAG TPA: DUF2937 family protein [Polaromonas sp.]|uniref:DUF2937 family protein n=1 Tax=Polaromonas sp. TaxID=1869339 RepID=UPI002D30C07A|nr:DUF2937 family protein [Polaromonas sp.]HYW56692.1 DUF2937 family protein [Polaromonas sp.]